VPRFLQVIPTTASAGSHYCFADFANPCWIGIYRFSVRVRVRLKQGTDTGLDDTYMGETLRDRRCGS